MRKYIDLTEQVIRDRMRGPVTGMGGESYALDWLDRNPDEVPGLATAITRSQWDAATKIADQFVVCDIANAWGLCIIPDPEPTNAEKLAKLLEDNEQVGLEINESSLLGELLDEAGVKAPEEQR